MQICKVLKRRRQEVEKINNNNYKIQTLFKDKAKVNNLSLIKIKNIKK